MNRRSFLKTVAASMAAAVVPLGCTPQPKDPVPPQPKVRRLGQAHQDLLDLMRERAVKEMMLEEDQRFIMAVQAAAA